MKTPLAYHSPLLLAFFLLLTTLGTTLCYVLMQHSQDEDIRIHLKQAIVSLDLTLTHAKAAAEQTERYLGEYCTEDILIGIRTIVATIPDVRAVSLARNNEIYCTSIFGKKIFSLEQMVYQDGSLTLMSSKLITPPRPMIVYTLKDLSGNSVLISISGYYLYNVLNMPDGKFHIYLRVGERNLDRHGQISTSPAIRLPVALASEHFNYSVIADRAGQSLFSTFIQYERNHFIATVVISLISTWLFRVYLMYRSSLAFMLREAIKHNHLKPYIQPIVQGDNSRIVGGEVLVRWEHPKLGFIPPEKFISVAEQTGLIKEVSVICFNEVIKQLQGQSLPEGLFICFNTSAVNFQNNEIVMLCKQFLSRLERLKAQVVLEITERETIKHTELTETLTAELRQLGVLFSLDDFGTGNANYSYLQQFQPEFIKVDKMFTLNVDTHAASAKVVRNMVSLARKFNCRIIAEGVENFTQLQILSDLGVEIFQGYYFSKPLPVPDYVKAFIGLSEYSIDNKATKLVR